MGALQKSGMSLLEEFGSLSTVPVRAKQEAQVVFLDPIKDQNEGTDSRDVLMKSIIHELTNTSEKVERLSFEVDPNLHTYNSVYIAKHGLIPDAIIKKIIIQDDLVAAIVHARETQIGSFGRPRYDRHEAGFVIEPMAGVIDKLDDDKKKEFDQRIKRAVRLFSTCGSEENVPEKEKMSFSEYLQRSTRNAVSLGRIATEIVRVGTNKDTFHSFRPTDVGTIFHAAKEKNAEDKLREEAKKALERIKKTKLDPVRFAKGDYAWVQVIEGQPRQAFTDNELYVCNFYPVNDIEMLGYPITPIDTMFTAISTHLNIATHNRMYFQTGRASRGMLIFRSDDIGPQTLANVKQQFNASINGVGNCVSGTSTIITKEVGGTTIENYLGDMSERLATIWTPSGWQPGMVYRTGLKELVETKISNGVVLKTSPDHQFKTIDENGELIWKRQDEFQVDDFVLVNRKQVESGTKIPLLNGKELNADMMEVLGWMTGDGKQDDNSIRLYYHHEKEGWIREKHFKVLESFGLDPKLKDETISDEEQEKICNKYGFKTCAATRIGINVFNTKLINDLVELGFTRSRQGVDSIGKSIPGFVYTLPEELKSAFICGLFSADGNNAKLRSPELTCCNHHLRSQVRQLLLSLSIRTCLSEGKTKRSFGSDGKSKEYVEVPSVLRIKDRDLFFDKVGFLQPHKQPLDLNVPNRAAMHDEIPQALALKLVKLAKDKTKLPRGGNDHNVGLNRVFTKRQQMDLDEVIRGERRLSRTRLERILEVAEIKVPEWMERVHFEKVVEIKPVGITVEMFDVAIYEPSHSCLGLACKSAEHMFFLDGIYSKNSWRMPVFGVPVDGDITYTSIDSTAGRDAEYTYLLDQNARTILSAFQMSPDELPGWSYLSKGTNSQALSEGNQEFRIEAGRDQGIRPLMHRFEDFINTHLFPLIDAELAKSCRLRLVGLDADTPEKEIVRLIQDAPVFMTYDGIRERVEMSLVGKKMGGDYPLNPQFQAVLDKFFTIGEQKAFFTGDESARADEDLAYIPNAFWFQWQQLQQAATQAASAPPGGAAPGGDVGGQPGDSQGNSGVEQPPGGQAPNANQAGGTDPSQAPQAETGEDLTRSIDQALFTLSKSEKDLPISKRKLLAQGKLTVEAFRKGLTEEWVAMAAEVLEVANKSL